MRPTVSIVLPTRNEWDVTRACLEAVRPTLGVRDEVIVVDNGSVDGTAQGLRRYGWAKVVSHPEEVGFAASCNSAAATATGEIVLFLSPDSLVPSRWLDALLAPFAEPTVAATGPRSNAASGPQLVERADYDPARMPELHRFARDWRQSHAGQTTEVAQLTGPCLAVRRDVFTQLGGFGEGRERAGEVAGLCHRLTGAGHRLLVADGSYVHQGAPQRDAADLPPTPAPVRPSGGLRIKRERASSAPNRTDGPLLSACLIVRDEEDNLPSCLEGLRGLVDEIVVYDTGSTDRTVQIARDAGAVVREGYWDDDFGRARNAALEACSGRWILHVDADEIVQGDYAALRAELTHTPDDTVNLDIDNLDSTGEVNFSHGGTRLFQRSRAHWQGRLHEQVVARRGNTLTAHKTSAVRIVHSGYTAEAMEGRQKTERNLRVAQASNQATGGTDARIVLNLARTLTAAGKYTEAIEHYSQARSLTTEPALLRQALRAGAESLMSVGRSGEALEWIEGLRQHSSSTTMPDFLEGIARLNLLDTAGSLACFERIDEAQDEDFTVAGYVLQLRRGMALAAAQRWSEAAAEILTVVQERQVTDAVWAPLVEAQWRTDRPMGAVADAAVGEHLVLVLGQTLNATPLAADAFGEELWQRLPDDPRLLAFAVRLAPQLPLDRALEWSARLRAAGLPEQCPLIALAETATAAPLDRLRAAVVAAETFGDERSRPSLTSATRALAPADFRAALLAVDELAPALLPTAVAGMAATPSRCRELADALRSLGAEEQADAVLAQASV